MTGRNRLKKPIMPSRPTMGCNQDRRILKNPVEVGKVCKSVAGVLSCCPSSFSRWSFQPYRPRQMRQSFKRMTTFWIRIGNPLNQHRPRLSRSKNCNQRFTWQGCRSTRFSVILTTSTPFGTILVSCFFSNFQRMMVQLSINCPLHLRSMS